MPSPAWEDLGAFLQLDSAGGFATTAQLTRASASAPVTITGIFDEAYVNAEIGETDLDASRPRFQGAETDLAGIKRGDTLVIHGKSYEAMTNTQATGDGWAVIELEAVE